MSVVVFAEVVEHLLRAFIELEISCESLSFYHYILQETSAHSLLNIHLHNFILIELTEGNRASTEEHFIYIK